MISKSELKDFASEHGYELSEWQISEWHQRGIIPSLVRGDTGGKSGSVWSYPDSAKATLLLALESYERDTLDGLLLDVWLRGGDVDVEKIRQVLLKVAKPLVRFVRNTETAIDKLTSYLKKVNKRRLSGPLADTRALLTAMNVAINVMSPNDDDVVWGIDMPGDPDENAATVADRLFGAEQLRAMSPESYGETPEIWLDDIKKSLNARRCVEAVKNASHAELYWIRQPMLVLESWTDCLTELVSFMPGRGSVFAFLKAIKVPRAMMRIMGSIVLLTLQSDPEGRQLITDAIMAWRPHLERLNAMKNYMQHMKKHPKLKRRKHWKEYLSTCSSDELESIRAHHRLFVENHPNQFHLLLFPSS